MSTQAVRINTTPGTTDRDALMDEIRKLARERNAIILAHNYQVSDVQDIANVPEIVSGSRLKRRRRAPS